MQSLKETNQIFDSIKEHDNRLSSVNTSQPEKYYPQAAAEATAAANSITASKIDYEPEGAW